MFRTATTTSLGSLPRARPAAIGRTGLRLSRDPFRAILFVITVLTVSRVHQHFPLLAKARPVLVLYMLTAAFIVLAPRSVSMTTLFRTWPPKVVAALGVVACISALFGISFGGAASFLVSVYSSVLVYAFLLFIGIRNARELYTFVWAFLVGVALLVWQALAVFHRGNDRRLQGDVLPQVETGRSGVGFPDGGRALRLRAVAAFQQQGTLLVAGKKGKVTSAMLLVGIGVALARSGSRGAFVGLIGTGCALLLLLKRVSLMKRVGFVAIVGGGLAVAAPPGYWEQIGTVLSPTKDYNWQSGDGRREIWARGIGYMLDYPAFGIGINNFERAEGTISDKARRSFAGDPIRWVAPHNSFVQVGAELGLPGLILWSSLIVGGIVGMSRLRRRLPPAWAHGDAEERLLYLATFHLPLALIGFAITASFVSFAYLDLVYMLAAFVAGVYVAASEKARRTAATQVR